MYKTYYVYIYIYVGKSVNSCTDDVECSQPVATGICQYCGLWAN